MPNESHPGTHHPQSNDDGKANSFGTLIFDLFTGVSPLLLSLAVAGFIVPYMWNPKVPYAPIGNYFERAISLGHCPDLDAVFIPIDGFYVVICLSTMANALRKRHSWHPGRFVTLLFLPLISLTFATIVNCISYIAATVQRRIQESAALHDAGPLGVLINFDPLTAEYGLITTIIAILCIEIYIVVHKIPAKVWSPSKLTP